MNNPYAVPVSNAPVETRQSFLRKVGGMTFVGLAVAATSSVVSMGAVLALEPLRNQFVMLAVMLGAIFASRMVGGSLVNSEDRSTQLLGFFLGTGLQGVAMSYIVLAAAVFSSQLYAGNPFIFIGQALALVGLTVTGMIAYLLTGPKNLSMVGGALAALSLPMLVLMVVSFVFPIGGPFGILLSLLFVGVSAGGLLYNLNHVMHHMRTDMVVPAAYHVTLGMLVLFWNLLSLLMRLQRR